MPGKVFENLGIRFECTLFGGISGIIEFTRDVGFSLPTERELTWTLEKGIIVTPKRSAII